MIVFQTGLIRCSFLCCLAQQPRTSSKGCSTSGYCFVDFKPSPNNVKAEEFFSSLYMRGVYWLKADVCKRLIALISTFHSKWILFNDCRGCFGNHLLLLNWSAVWKAVSSVLSLNFIGNWVFINRNNYLHNLFSTYTLQRMYINSSPLQCHFKVKLHVLAPKRPTLS